VGIARFPFLGERLLLGAALRTASCYEDHSTITMTQKEFVKTWLPFSRWLILVYRSMNSAFHLHPIFHFNPDRKFQPITAEKHPCCADSAPGVHGSWRKTQGTKKKRGEGAKIAPPTRASKRRRLAPPAFRRVPRPSAPFHRIMRARHQDSGCAQTRRRIAASRGSCLVPLPRAEGKPSRYCSGGWFFSFLWPAHA